MAKGTVNKVILMGRLGQDPDIRATASGTQVANLNLATNEIGPVDPQTNQRKESTEWHRVVLFGRMAENASTYLRKGNQVYLEGRLQTRKWKDQQDIERYSTEIVASEMQFIGGSQNSEGNRGSQGGYQPQGGAGNQPAQGFGQPAQGFGNAGNTGAPAQQRTTAPSQGSGGAPASAQSNSFDDFEDDIPF